MRPCPACLPMGLNGTLSLFITISPGGLFQPYGQAERDEQPGDDPRPHCGLSRRRSDLDSILQANEKLEFQTKGLKA